MLESSIVKRSSKTSLNDFDQDLLKCLYNKWYVNTKILDTTFMFEKQKWIYSIVALDKSWNVLLFVDDLLLVSLEWHLKCLANNPKLLKWLNEFLSTLLIKLLRHNDMLIEEIKKPM